ncbi:MAG TPA: GNAT family N-acetyltransferase [Longimicrobiaceae bacterium]|nr:GNAT family N-acetyltransferase [Longimicrobiaceae bacterium]
MTPRAHIEIRDARDDEREAMRALTLAAYGEFARVMAPDAWAELRDALHRALNTDVGAERIVAECDGGIVGSVMLFPAASATYGGSVEAPPWPELRLLAVHPDVRGGGVGRMLVEECVRRARAAGARALGLHTSRSMAAAIRMYRRMGFVRAPEHDFQPPGAERVEGYRLPL